MREAATDVFWPDDRPGVTPPMGFGLFRALDDVYELWLAGLELGRRGEGQRRVLHYALFDTAPGKKTWIVRIARVRDMARCSIC